MKIKINGVSYNVTHTADGKEVWDPPRPAGDEERCKARLEEMIELGVSPAANDDTTFLAGRPSLRESFGGDHRSFNNMLKGARKHGYEPKSTDIYLRGVARFPGDPSAFFNAGDGRGKIKKICEKRGVGCEGAVNVPTPSARMDPAEKPTTPKKFKKKFKKEIL